MYNLNKCCHGNKTSLSDVHVERSLLAHISNQARFVALHCSRSFLRYFTKSHSNISMDPDNAPAPRTELESSEETDLRDLSVILRSNVFPGSSYSSDEWCSVVKNVYHNHEISPDKEVGIYMKPRKDFRRKVG